MASFYKDLSSYAGKTVTVCGWARSIRDSKTLGFIDLNDGTSFKGVQVVFEDGKIDNFKEIASQNVGAALCVTGTLLATPEAKQPFEIHAQKIVVEGPSSPEYPLQKKRHTVEFLRTIAHLRPRTNLYSAAFRVRSAAAFGVHKFFQENGFSTLEILHNNCAFYEEVALCGTRGWFYEEDRGEHSAKIFNRELIRLETSLKAGGEREKICFLHYPPIYQGYRCQEILDLLKQYAVKLCCYGHLHGASHRLAAEGKRGSVEYRLVSADYLGFRPQKICE